MIRVAHTWREGWLVAVLLHGGFLAWLFLAAPPRPAPPARPPTRVRLAEPPPPRPAAEPVPLPEPPRAAAPAARPRPERPVAKRSEVAPASPPLAAAPAAAEAPLPLRRFSVSMEATVAGGGVAVPVAPSGAAPGVRGVPGGTSDDPRAPVTAAEVQRAPRLLFQPPSSETRALYPEVARRENLEADVLLELVISEVGRVEEVKVVGPAGSGFDEVAVSLVRRFRFEPAEQGGKSVPARIPWTYRFRLEG